VKKMLRFLIGFLTVGILLFIRFSWSSNRAVEGDNGIRIEGSFPKVSATFLGTRSWERVGYSLMSAGDVNNDGFDDFLVGSFHYNAGGWDRGVVYLLLGRPEGFGINVSLKNADAGFVGEKAYDGVGYSVSSGDINGDGFSDFLIGAPDGSEKAQPNPGYVYLVFGKANIDWGINAVINRVANVRFIGENGVDMAGLGVAVVGDMNGDGCNEFIISSPMFDISGDENQGKVYFFRGKKKSWAGDLLLSQADGSFITYKKNSFLGYSIAGVGDVNNDGIPDFAMGSRYINRAYLMFGRSEMDWGKNFDMSRADVTFIPEKGCNWLGWLVRGVGDVNGDGYDDFIISDPSYNSSRGIVYLIFGRDSFQSTYNLTYSSASFKGENPSDNAGFWISSAGDVNSDGMDDFLIGAPGYSTSYLRAGKVYIVWGKKEGWTRNVSLSSISDYIVGMAQDSIQLGECVSLIGDINGDNGSDFAVSAPYFDSWGRENAGKIYVFLGKPGIVVSGKCFYQKSKIPVPNVFLRITGTEKDSCLTDKNGAYRFSFNTNGYYLCIPFKPSGEDIGDETITSFDASIAAQYTVGLVTFDSLQQKAADVDENGKVDLTDIVSIARYVVGLPCIGSSHVGEWRFIPPFREYPRIPADCDSENFSAIVLGDVSGNWTLPTGMNKSYSASVLPLDSMIVSPMDTVSIPLISKEGVNLISSDIWLRYDANVLKFLGATTTSVSRKFNVICNDSKTGFVKVALYGIYPISQVNTFLIIKFQVISNINQETTISWEKYQLNECLYNKPAIHISVVQTGVEITVPIDFHLEDNFPNPFNSGTTISYQLGASGKVSLIVYDVMGRRIRTLVNSVQSPGKYQVRWDGKNDKREDVPSGIYICRLKAGGRSWVLKMAKTK